jgi:2-methylcitrate dehydratase
MERLTEQIATFAQGLTYADLPPAAIAKAKDLILDAVGCAFGAVSSPPARIAQAMAAGVTSTRPATVLCTGHKTSPDLAAFANGVMIRYLDYNPSDVISAVLAATEAGQGDGKSAIVGMVLAFEVLDGMRRDRNAAAGGFTQWDSATYTNIAASAVAAKQLGLDLEQTGHAISLASVSHLTLGKVRRGQMSHWKGAATANASRNAVFCALLASQGMTGPNPVFEGRNGFFEAIGTDLEFEPTPSGEFRIMDAYVKWAPCGFYGQPAIEAALELRGQIESLDTLEEVRILTSPHGAEAMATDVSRWKPETRETADHSLPFVVAMALMEGGLQIRHYDEEYYKRTDVRDLMARIKVNVAEEFGSGFARLPFTEVAVESRSGEVRTARVVHPLGHPQRPMSDADYERKFRSMAEPVLPEPQLALLVERIRTLDQAKNLGEVLQLTAPPPRA